MIDRTVARVCSGKKLCRASTRHMHYDTADKKHLPRNAGIMLMASGSQWVGPGGKAIVTAVRL